MKKILLFSFIALISTLSVHSQDNTVSKPIGFSKGDILVGGNIKYNSSVISGVSGTPSTAMVGPSAAYFIHDNVAVEFGFAFGHDNLNKDTSSDFLVGARYYVLNLKNRFRTYTNFAWNFGSWEYANQKPTYSQLSAGVGVNYFFNSKVVFNLGIGNIISYNTTKDSGNKTTSFDVNLNEFKNIFNQPTFGVAYRF